MKERPILFSGPMVRAIIQGRKTVTRRVIIPQPDALREYGGLNPEGHTFCPIGDNDDGWKMRDPLFIKSRFGVAGDRLWVRETFAEPRNDEGTGDDLFYRADECNGELRAVLDADGIPWRPSIFMPRALSRITLEVTDIRVEQVQAITESDAKLEGFEPGYGPHYPGDKISSMWTARDRFSALWEILNKPRGFGWGCNCWVWVVSFKPIEIKRAAA